jgi:hypothetical protein
MAGSQELDHGWTKSAKPKKARFWRAFVWNPWDWVSPLLPGSLNWWRGGESNTGHEDFQDSAQTIHQVPKNSQHFEPLAKLLLISRAQQMK